MPTPVVPTPPPKVPLNIPFLTSLVESINLYQTESYKQSDSQPFMPYPNYSTSHSYIDTSSNTPSPNLRVSQDFLRISQESVPFVPRSPKTKHEEKKETSDELRRDPMVNLFQSPYFLIVTSQAGMSDEEKKNFAGEALYPLVEKTHV